MKLAVARLVRLASRLSVVLVAVVLTGCNRNRVTEGTNISKVGAASISLGVPDMEHGRGLQHMYWENDGATTPTVLDGKPCRQLKLENIKTGFLYFAIEDGVKREGLTDALIELEFFDDSPGDIGLQYDASNAREGSGAAYTDTGAPVHHEGSKLWQMAAFRVHDASFSGAENSGADFRFSVEPPVLCVRRVTLTPLDRLETLGQSVPPKDFSRAATVSVALGNVDAERGSGLQHVYFEDDGRTAVAVLDGVPCRRLRTDGRRSGYFYFIIDPTFKTRDSMDVTVDVDYFDSSPGAMGLEFDGSKTVRMSNAAYANTRQVVWLTGVKEWKRAVFDVRGGTFDNSQNSKSDFRIWMTPPNLYVRSVTVIRGAETRRFHQSPEGSGDFSGSASVSAILGEPTSENVNGLQLIDWEKDGLNLATNLDGIPCRYTTLPQGDTGYFYFSIDPTFKKHGLKNAVIEVDYYDTQPGRFEVEFDARESQRTPNGAYTKASPVVRMKGVRSWQTATFSVRNAAFSNRQNSGADFRICARPPAILIRRVTVTREHGN